MHGLTQEAERVVAELSGRYGVSPGAAATLLQALVNGRGTMAQFSHPELGGSGQWMLGGMTMVGDMFNHGLKATVDGLCSELSRRLADGLVAFPPPHAPMTNAPTPGYQSQSQGYGGYGYGSSGWWPSELGQPAATGSQNAMRYAYFPGTRRLAVDANGFTAIYDTLDHQIGGFSQQQSGSGTITFSSQYGTVALDRLPRVDGPASPPPPAPPALDPSPSFPPPPSWAAASPAGPAGPAVDVFAALERLGELNKKGILTDQEFAAKKAELLSRL